MSNLIKSVYFNFDTKATRSIDSDERIEEFIPDIFEEKKEEPEKVAPDIALLTEIRDLLKQQQNEETKR